MPPLDPKKDKDFLSATPEQQHAYLMSVDRDYARATPELQKQYLSSITGGVKKLSSPQILANANKPTPKFDAEQKEEGRFHLFPKGGGSAAGEFAKGAGEVAASTLDSVKDTLVRPENVPGKIKAAFTPSNPDEKYFVATAPGGVTSLGHAMLPIFRNIVKPTQNAVDYYSDVAKGKGANDPNDYRSNPLESILSVAPKALGAATASVEGGRAMPDIPGVVGDVIKKKFGPLLKEDGADLIADAFTPKPKDRPQFKQNLIDHWDKITSYAKEHGIPLDSVANVKKATQGASDMLTHHFDNIIEPYKDQVNPQTGMKLGAMHDRVSEINNKLIPAYEKSAGGIDPLQAVKAQGDLHAEADALRFHLYHHLSEVSGIDRGALADVNQGGGALRNVRSKMELGESKLKNQAAVEGRNPVNVSPFSEKQFFINKGANYMLKKAGLTTDPDTLIGRAFSRTPSYDYSLPDLPNLPDPLAPKTRPVPSWKGDPAASSSPLPPAPSPEPYVSKQATKAKDAAVAGPRAQQLIDLAQPEDTSYLSLTHQDAEPIAGAGSGVQPVAGDPMSPSGSPIPTRPFKRKALPPPSFIPLSDGLPSINE